MNIYAETGWLMNDMGIGPWYRGEHRGSETSALGYGLGIFGAPLGR